MKIKRPHNSTFIVSEVKTQTGFDLSCGFQVQWKINPHMMIGASSLDQAEFEHAHFVTTLESCGAEVLHVPYIAGAYDSVFMKDNALLTRNWSGTRALLMRTSSRERAIEPERRAEALIAHGIEITDRAEFALEGGDICLHAPKEIAFLGYGQRSSPLAKRQLQDFLNMDVTTLELTDPYFYHLDTALNLTEGPDGTVAFALRDAFTYESWRRLINHPGIDEVVNVDREEAMHFALNWVEIEGSIILGARCPKTQAQLEKLGKETLVRSLSQFQLAGGSAACLVAPVHDLRFTAAQGMLTAGFNKELLA